MPQLVVPPAPGRLPPRRGGSPESSRGTAGPRSARAPLAWLRAPVPPAALEESKGRGQKNEIRVYCRKGRGERGQAQPSYGSVVTGTEQGSFQRLSTCSPPSSGPAPQLPLTRPGRGDVGIPQPLPSLGEHPSPLHTCPSPLSPPQRPPSMAGRRAPVPHCTRHSSLSPRAPCWEAALATLQFLQTQKAPTKVLEQLPPPSQSGFPPLPSQWHQRRLVPVQGTAGSRTPPTGQPLQAAAGTPQQGTGAGDRA